MNRKILQEIIDDFKAENFIRFFRAKNDKFRHPNETLYYEDDNFGEGKRIEEITFDDGDLIVCTFLVKKELSERSGKKAQYDLGKKILKETQTDAGIFIFYDKTGSFRFSLIYANYLGKRRDWSTFRRFTYFVSKELTNKTFLQRIGDGDFSALAKIKEAFSVEKVTKEFYEDIANWYFWAVEHCRFPKDAEAEENGRNVAVIRLITRMIFIWFMRERGLVPKELFEDDNIQKVLKDVNPNSQTYYQAILQNLFFATLSTKKEERQFRDEKRFNKGWNKDFGNQYVYRFHNLFTNPKKIKEYFGNIPFLNGGLFECLDDGRNDIYIDGFTERKKEYQPEIPNFLFFSGDKKADLNKYYGTKNKNHKVRGLFNILSSFNFTIDENSPDDADIALDPELLGRVFENLLASFNPETSTTARKATGSYYTPREIVDYMVTESLKEYFKTHLPEVRDIYEKLEILFSTGSDENPFSKSESKKLVKLVESVRIVDPAVGSGAFPMGALNKMVFILGKIDPGNELWKQAQLEATDAIPDPQVRRNTKKQIEEFFKDKNADYGRKLYLIQKCIYGVDIQQIAVEIAKLRFFISLLVDEKIDEKKENWGIEPLPNLDFKIMQGNSLISEFLGIDFDNEQSQQEQAGMLFAEKEEDSLIKEFEQKKIDFQNESYKEKKAKLKNEAEDLMVKIFETKVRKQKTDYFRQMEEIEKKYSTLPNKKTREEITVKEKQKISQKTGFDLENIEKQLREFNSKNKTKPFFAWKLYFAEVFEKGGFDVVISNPPYGFRDILTPEEKAYFRTVEKIDFSSGDSAELFCKKCFDKLVKNRGMLTFIIPKKSLYGEAWEGYRKKYWRKFDLRYLIDSSKAFENVLLEMNVFGLVKIEADNLVACGYLNKNSTIVEIGKADKHVIFLSNNTAQIYKLSIPKSLWNKIQELKVVDSLVAGKLGLAIGTDFYSDKKTDYKLLKGIDITRWKVRQNRWLKNKSKLNWGSAKEFLTPKVICQRLVAHIENPYPHIKITACYDEEGIIITNTLMSFDLDEKISPKFWLAYLNSAFTSWYAYNFIYARAIRSMDFYNFYIQQIPIPKIIIEKSEQQKPFIDLVDEILAITKDEDYLENSAKQTKVRDYEKQINQLIYRLYGLTPEEIKIVEQNSK